MPSRGNDHMDIVADRTAALEREERKQSPPTSYLEKPETSQAYSNDPFGNEEDAEVKYRTLAWWECGMLMIAETISLGILSLPSAVAALGLAPAIILIIGLGLVATYTGYTLGQFKLRYPHVHSMADVGEVLLGAFGREFLGAAQLIFLIFVMGSHILTFTVMMNTLTEHAICSIAFGVVGLVVSLICTLPRTLKKVSWLSVTSFISIFAAVMIAMIAIGIQKPGDGRNATTENSFYRAFIAVTNIVFAFAIDSFILTTSGGHVSFFGFISEMRNPTEYPKTLYLLQGTDISLYVIVAVVIYVYAGKDVVSPALGSAGPLISKIAYGVAIPTLVIAGVIYAHVAGKYIYVRIFRGTEHMQKRTWLSIGSWVGIITILWIIGWVIAEAIPVFNNLLALITALFASWFTYGLGGVFWLYLYRGSWFSSPKNIFLTVVNVIIFGMGAALCGLGLYVSGKAIHDDRGGASFSCADTS